jgi:hypothetical protein
VGGWGVFDCVCLYKYVACIERDVHEFNIEYTPCACVRVSECVYVCKRVCMNIYTHTFHTRYAH